LKATQQEEPESVDLEEEEEEGREEEGETQTDNSPVRQASLQSPPKKTMPAAGIEPPQFVCRPAVLRFKEGVCRIDVIEVKPQTGRGECR
jgi:hypothetical protein